MYLQAGRACFAYTAQKEDVIAIEDRYAETGLSESYLEYGFYERQPGQLTCD
jgi:hypothetical protein